MKRNYLRIFILLICILLLSSCSPKQTGTQFVKVNGTGFSEGNQPYTIKSISVSTDETFIPSEQDYQTVRGLGFNAVRLHLDYKLFEDDAQPYIYLQKGWDLLERHISYAKKNDIKILMNMHVPQGGYQSGGKGTALWTEPENQDRLAELWGAIAKKYADETAVLGYGLVNEPFPCAPDVKTGQKYWSDLAGKLAERIRDVDQNHILFAEVVSGITDGEGNPQNVVFTAAEHYGYPELEDANVAYEFHMYDPYAFTHQVTAEAGTSNKPYTSYPNEFITASENQKYVEDAYRGGSLDVSNPQEQTITSELISLDGSKPRFFQTGIAVISEQTGGNVWLTSLRVDEYDQNRNLVRNVLKLDMDTPETFLIWTGGDAAYFDYDPANKAVHLQSLYSMYSAVLNEASIPVKKGNFYQVKAAVRASGFGPGSEIRPFINVYECDSYKVLNINYLSSQMNMRMQFSLAFGKAMFLGEFGAAEVTYSPERGGQQWIQDMRSLAEEKGLSYNYFAYNDGYFDIDRSRWNESGGGR